MVLLGKKVEGNAATRRRKEKVEEVVASCSTARRSMLLYTMRSPWSPLLLYHGQAFRAFCASAVN